LGEKYGGNIDFVVTDYGNVNVYTPVLLKNI